MKLTCELKAGGRQIKKTFEANGRSKISGQMVFVVICDDATVLPLTLLGDSRLPQVGEIYVEGNQKFNDVYYLDATPRFVGRRANGYEWEIVYTLGGFDQPESTRNNDDNRGKDETLLQFSTSVELEDVATACDLDGKWNCNSNGEFFADPLTFKSGILTMQYQYKEYANPLETVKAYFQCVNGADWYGFPKHSVKVADISFSATQTSSGTTYDTTYKLQYRAKGWDVLKADSGFYYWQNQRLYRAMNADGSPTNEPVLLDGYGGLLASGNSPVFRPYRVYPEANLYGLELPNPFSL